MVMSPWITTVVLAVGVAAALLVVLMLNPWAERNHDYVQYPHAAIAANGYECSSIGREILQKNGTAVDAAIATLFCEGISCPQCMGLGGGFLATIYDAKTGRIRVMNARERAPAKTDPDMFANASSTTGGLAIAVPGELRGYGAMYREYGRLPWAELVRPTAELCRRGHRVNEYLGRVLKSYSAIIKAQPSLSEVYVNPETGEVWNEGDIIRHPTLARTLDIIAEEGPEAIHNGSLTAALVQDIAGFGGIITEDDLNNFRVEWQDPIAVPLTEEHTLYTTSLPGSGAVLAFILNMLRGWAGVNSSVPVGSDLYWHRIIETFKYAFAKRTGLGDLSHSHLSDDIFELERNMTDAAWAQTFRDLVNDTHTSNDWRQYGALFEGIDDHGTAHMVVVAPDGSVVSATSTINYIWGSQRRSQSLGIMLNNEMDDFSIPGRNSSYDMPPSPANMLAPGLQPLSSMVPSIVMSKSGTAVLAIGAAGGTKITTQIAMSLINIILEGGQLPEVTDRPRIHHQLMPMQVDHEDDFDEHILTSLVTKGHLLMKLPPTSGFAAIMGVQRDASGSLLPHTDRRRIGSVDGF